MISVDFTLDDLTDRMFRILQIAQRIMKSWGETRIGAEHVLAAICEEPGNVARGLLVRLGVNVLDVEPLLREVCVPDEPKIPDASVLLSLLEGKTDHHERLQIIEKWNKGEYEETSVSSSQSICVDPVACHERIKELESEVSRLKDEMSKAGIELVNFSSSDPDIWAKRLMSIPEEDWNLPKTYISATSLRRLAQEYLECQEVNRRINKEADALNEELVRLREFRDHVVSLANEGKRMSKTT